MSTDREPVKTIMSKPLILEQTNIDTDQIIPARFLTTTSREGLGAVAFHDWRYDEAGKEKPDALLNQPWVKERSILLAGANFGCGSSREHAPWALLDFGIQVVISTQIADIFRANALKNGLLAIVVPELAMAHLSAEPEAPLTVDLEAQTITPGNRTAVPFEMDPFARHCLLAGQDQLGFLLAQGDAISQYEARAS